MYKVIFSLAYNPASTLLQEEAGHSPSDFALCNLPSKNGFQKDFHCFLRQSKTFCF